MKSFAFCQLRNWIATALMLCLSMLAARALAADERTGEQIYRQQCALCHGAAGEGTKDHYGKPLIGDRPVAELATVIAETMPEDDPEACTGDDAQKVAAYIYDAFYSRAAQARNDRPRIELSRLTVRQYQNAVADLIGSFTPPGNGDEQRGLRAEYFKDRRFRDRALTRQDAMIDFDFGQSSPDNDKLAKDEFAIRWDGAVLAPETGEYEFIIKTQNGARLWVNDSQRPLIDAWVRSGTDIERRESMRLLGGRVYPLRLEFFKSKEGKETSASIALLWKPPHQVDQVIPQQNLSPNRVPMTFVVTTPFPPDDRSTGYERGTSVSKEWDEATTYAAIEVAGYVANNVQQLSGVSNTASDRQQRLREFCYRFAERAFRRPLSPDQKPFFVDRQFEGASSPETAVKQVVLLVLKSPRFLYREVSAGDLDQYDVASRISFALWDSPPDQPLLDAAASGQLNSHEQIARQAERMLGDLRSKAKVREFFHQWLRIDEIHDVSKDPELFPEFNETVLSDLRFSLDRFIDDVVWSEASDFRQLLLADWLYMNGRLAGTYGVDLPADAPFQKVSLDPQQRAGVLSHPFLLTGFAYHSTSSPIHRGVFISRSLLGRSLRPPPDAVTPLAPDLHPDLTTRERVLLQTSPMACRTCHDMINPLGLSLEHYDAIGRYRSQEKGRAIDAGGQYNTLAGETVAFAGVREMATFLANCPETHAAFVEQLFHHVVKQPVGAFGPDRLDELQNSFSQSGFNIRQLLIEITAASAQRQ